MSTLVSDSRTILRLVLVAALSLPLGGAGALASEAPPEPAAELPPGKQTTLGLYLTASEAWAMWEAAPDSVIVLDVRTPEEFLFVGHPAMAWNIPAFLQTYEWDAENSRLPMVPNPDFVSAVQEVAGPGTTLLVLCRSGGRSARAVDLLAAAGFERAYSIVDGMEGDTLRDPADPRDGQRVLNGWKNSGLPWTCEVDPSRMVLPDRD